jgi:hypothetical protein
VKRLDQRFGRSKLLDFFQDITRHYHQYDAAAEDAFDTTWAAVQADLVASIQAYGRGG